MVAPTLPVGRSDRRVQIRGRALVSRMNPPGFTTLGGPHVRPAFVSQQRCLLESARRIPGDGGGGVGGGVASLRSLRPFWKQGIAVDELGIVSVWIR